MPRASYVGVDGAEHEIVFFPPLLFNRSLCSLRPLSSTDRSTQCLVKERPSLPRSWRRSLHASLATSPALWETAEAALRVALSPTTRTCSL